MQTRDLHEGADILMVKPALPYLDIIADAAQLAPDHPLACYQVSGEYAMVVAGARAGVYDLRAMAFETTESFVRAGEWFPFRFLGFGFLLLGRVTERVCGAGHFVRCASHSHETQTRPTTRPSPHPHPIPISSTRDPTRTLSPSCLTHIIRVLVTPLPAHRTLT